MKSATRNGLQRWAVLILENRQVARSTVFFPKKKNEKKDPPPDEDVLAELCHANNVSSGEPFTYKHPCDGPIRWRLALGQTRQEFSASPILFRLPPASAEWFDRSQCHADYLPDPAPSNIRGSGWNPGQRGRKFERAIETQPPQPTVLLIFY